MQSYRIVKTGKTIIVAVTAASGAVYARLTVEALLRCGEVERIMLIYSTHAAEVA